MSNEWTYHASISTEDWHTFYEAMNDSTDNSYKPIVVARQIENGINYRYMCIVTSNTEAETSSSFFAIVSIHKPFNENGYVHAIQSFSISFPNNT